MWLIESWGLLMDEAAFQPEAGEAYDAAVPVYNKKILVRGSRMFGL